MIHMQTEPPAPPIIRRLRRPSLSMRKNSQMMVRAVLTTPKIPVVRKAELVPWIPIDLKTVGE